VAASATASSAARDASSRVSTKSTHFASRAPPSGRASSATRSHQTITRAAREGSANANAQATSSSSTGTGSVSCGATPKDSPAAMNAAPGSGTSSPATYAM